MIQYKIVKRRGKIGIRLSFWCALLLVNILLLLPGESLPTTSFSDKFEHLLAFLILTFLGLLAYPRQGMTIGIGLVIMGSLLEAAQMAIPGRNASALDVMANAAGVILGILLRVLLVRLFALLKPFQTGGARIGDG